MSRDIRILNFTFESLLSLNACMYSLALLSVYELLSSVAVVDAPCLTTFALNN